MSNDASEVPRLAGLPFLGSLPALAWKQLDLLDRAHSELGNTFELDLGVTTSIFVADPELAEDVLVRNARNYDKGGDFWDTLREALGQGLPVSRGDLWRRQRRLMNPEFSQRRLDAFRDTITETVAEELDSLGGHAQPTDVEAWAYHVLATLTIRVLLGSKLALATVDRLRPSMATMLDHALLGLITRRLPPWIPRPGRKRFLAARDIVDQDVTSIIQERRTTVSNGHDLLGLLIAATDEQGSMDDAQLRDEIVALYIGGYETTGSTLAWTLWLLAEHPELLEELQAELDTDPDSIEHPLLDACVREGLRLYPPGPLIPRRAAAETVLGNYRIPQGANVMVAPWLIHRNPQHWPDPLVFDPKRFLEAGSNEQRRHRLAWCPFGAGQRTCIGKELAMMELRYSLALILRRFSIRRVPSRRPRLRLSTTIRSRSGVFLHIEERAPRS